MILQQPDTQQKVEYTIYVDDLSTDPSISTNTADTSTTSEVKSVEYTMGIPSVKKFELSMKRKYLNINSTHKFIPGNRKIAEILDVNKTSLTSDKSILLAQVNINTTGDYSYAGTPEGA